MTTTLMYMSYLSVGVLVVIYLPLCAGVLRAINRLLRKAEVSAYARRAGLLVLSVLMFLLPTWDAILAKYYLDQYCARDGGLTTNKSVRAEGFYIPSRFTDADGEKFLEYGYSFLEMNDEDSGYIRYLLNDKKQVIRSRVRDLMAEYAVTWEMSLPIAEHFGIKVGADDQHVRKISDGETINSYRSYHVTGVYVDRMLMSAFGGFYISCEDVFSGIERFKRENLIVPLAKN